MKRNILLFSALIFIGAGCAETTTETSEIPTTEQPETVQTNASTASGDLKVAYINSDSLFSNYQLFKDLEEAFIEEKIVAEGAFKVQLDKLEKDYRDAQAGAANLSEQELQRMGMILQQREQELMGQKKQMEGQLMESEQDKNDRLYEELRTFLDLYAADLGYHMIYGYNGFGDVLYMDPQFDITSTVIDSLNRSYAKTQLEETASE
jgi:outer membrane protein